ncbi:MAG: hypothetical protein ABSG88_22005 [Bradyrhizobium sp.]
MPNFSFNSRYCDSTIADREFRKAHARLRFGIARRGREPVADRIGADDEIPVGVERLAGTDHEIDAVVIAADRRHHQDGVGFFLIQCPMRNIGDREILDRLAAFELEIAFVVGLVRRLLWRMRRRRERQQQAKACNKARHMDNTFHACFPLIIEIAPDDRRAEEGCEAFAAECSARDTCDQKSFSRLIAKQFGCERR